MFVKAIKIAKKCMFPIFRFEHVSPTQAQIHVVGSGFFINREGFFVSVAHVFDNPLAQTTFQYLGQVPDRLHKPPLKITEIGRIDDHDVFVGKVECRTDYFRISSLKSDVGRSACISGYPLAQLQRNSQGGLELAGVRRYFQPSFVLDYAVVASKNMHGKIRTHDGYLIRDLGLYGMSGGPVFDSTGIVIGVQGSVTQPRKSIGGDGESITIQNAVVIRSQLILNLLSKNHIRYNFFAKF